MKSYFSVLLSILLSFAYFPLAGQDISFSQYTVVAPYYNPAFTAAFNGNYRVSLINRDQWIGFADKAIQSFGILGDIKFDLGNQQYNGDYFGVGVYFLSDRAPLFDWNSNEASILISYHKLTNKHSRNYISGGIGFGVIQKSINYENLYFNDQFDGFDLFDKQTKENLPPNIFARADLKVGVQYNAELNKSLRVQTGISIDHIFRPDFSFYREFSSFDYVGSKSSKAFQRINVLSNFTYYQDKNNILSPRFLYSFQGPHHLLNAGCNYKHSFYSLNQTALHVGLSGKLTLSEQSLHFTDLGLTTGFEFRNFILGLHYDIGIRDLAIYNNPTHSFEISLSLIGNYDNNGYICPEF